MDRWWRRTREYPMWPIAGSWPLWAMGLILMGAVLIGQLVWAMTQGESQ